MKISKLSQECNKKALLKALNIDSGGIPILESKMTLHLFKIENMHVGAANILKQDALSIGADLGVPKGTVIAKEKHIDAVLIVTGRQLKKLCEKEKSQPFGLANLFEHLKRYLQPAPYARPSIMGIINANDDSFYKKSRFKGDDALNAVERMIYEGAEIIDIGGQSTKPGSIPVSGEIELQRVKPLIDAIDAQRLHKNTLFSIDSYEPLVIEYALRKGFSIVNDITGLQNDNVCRITAAYNASAVIMHMQGTPSTMQTDPRYDSLLHDIGVFFDERLQKAEHFGITKTILDVGIGFGKTLEDNLRLIKDLEHFSLFGKPLLIGASRKSMIDKIVPTSVEERLSGTLALHLEASKNGASILRVHDVKEHMQALKVQEALFTV